MSALLRIYDDVTSNKYISLGATVISTAFMAYRTVAFRQDTDLIAFVISVCAGVIFASLAKTYLAHNEMVKNDSERNGIYTTLSLLTAFTPITHNRMFRSIRYVFECRGYNFPTYGFLNGFGLSFTATNLALQLMNGQTKFKFRSPIEFS